MLQPKLQVGPIFFRQRWNGKRNPRQIDALMLTQRAAVNDLALHVAATHADDPQLDQPIRQQNASAGADLLRQAAEGSRDQRSRTLNLAGSDGDLRSRLEHDVSVTFELSGADLRALQVLQDA